MIVNDRQAELSRAKLAEIEREANAGSADERATYSAFAHEIECEIAEYESIRDGYTTSFNVTDINELLEALVKARISRGLNQRELAERLGVQPQQVQRDESGGYERAAAWRIADVLDALEFEIRGVVRRAEGELRRHDPQAGSRPPDSNKFALVESHSPSRADDED